MSRNIKQGGSIRRLASRAVPLMAVVVLVAAVSPGILGSRAEEAGGNGVAGGMSLGVVAAPNVSCDNPDDPTMCAVDTGTSFTLAVRVDSLPLAGGYIAFQTEIDYDGLTYLPTGTAAGEIVWPDGVVPVRATGGTIVNHADATGIVAPFPPSIHVGNIVEISLECPGTPGSHPVNLVPSDAGHPFGTFLRDTAMVILPSSDSLSIICEEPGGPIADKGVLGIEFDDATKTWPGPGPVIPDNHMDIDASLDGSQQYIVSVTSQDLLRDGEPPDDSWVGFYADIPAGCYGYWLPDDPALDMRTRYGDPFAYPHEIPDSHQMGERLDWGHDKEVGLDPPYPDLPFEADIHFQTRAYGLNEKLGVTLPLTRYFDFYCDEPSTHVFTFCNKIEPMPPWKDPDIDPALWPTYPGQPGDNVLCEDLTVEVWAEVDIQAGVAGFGDGVVWDADCFSAPPASIPVNQDVDLCLGKYVTHPGPDYLINPGIDVLMTLPPGCTLPVDPSGSWSLPMSQGEWVVIFFGGFTINCSQAGNKTFTIYDSWDLDEPEDEHITDPDTTNNDGHLDWQVDVLQDPTFSIARGGTSAPVPVDPADLVIRSPGGAWPPIDIYPCWAFGLAFCGSMGFDPMDDVNALSLGQDFTLPPPDPANPDAYLYFSVAPGATGQAGTGVNNETGCITGIPEPEADEFGSAALGGNYQFFDGDGFAACSNPQAPALGLAEPPPVGGLSDDLDALDPLNLTATGPPIYVSLDQQSPTLDLLNRSAADIFWDPGGAIAGAYALAGALGLDEWGPDDIDALCVNDADSNNEYTPGVDTVWFSLTPGSFTLLFWGGSAADIFAAPFTPGAPVVTAGQLGLRSDDDLNALKCYEESACTPPFTDLGLPEPDSDCDGAPDDAELGPDPSSCGTRDPNDPWDFYNVPVPTLGRGGDMYDRDSAVTILSDVLGVLEYSGTSDEGPPNTVPRDYDDDNDGDGYDDGLAYDRSVSTTGPWSGPPDGAIIILTDVLLVLAQSGHSC